VSIFMSVFNVHVNRYPVTGTVAYRQYNPGKFLHAAADKASLDNEQSSIGLEGPHGAVLVRQIAGLIARRIVTDGKVGDQATQGARLGMIRFGSRVDVYLPLTAHAVPRVQLGDRLGVRPTRIGEQIGQLFEVVVVNTGWRNKEHQLGRATIRAPDAVGYAGRYQHGVSWPGLEDPIPGPYLDHALDDVPDLLDPAVNVVACAEAWGNPEFEKGGAASRSIAACLVLDFSATHRERRALTGLHDHRLY
jgi:hypothetical protein